MGRARGRLKLRMQKVQQNFGSHTLVISEENMMGSMTRNLRQRSLYDDAGERVARFVAAFDGAVDQIVLGIRSLDHYWMSVAALDVMNGHPVPDRATLAAIASGQRVWRDVITDVACAAPEAEIKVMPFERFVGRPDAQLSAALGYAVPEDHSNNWLNRRPELPHLRSLLAERGSDTRGMRGPGDRWNPFLRAEVAALREAYADDMFWLKSGASGLATLTEDVDWTEAEWPTGPMMRGHINEFEERRMARSG